MAHDERRGPTGREHWQERQGAAGESDGERQRGRQPPPLDLAARAGPQQLLPAEGGDERQAEHGEDEEFLGVADQAQQRHVRGDEGVEGVVAAEPEQHPGGDRERPAEAPGNPP